MTIALFLVGAPGVGKTTAARALMKLLDPFESVFMNPKPKWTVSQTNYAAAGHYTGGAFDGADTVPYTGAMEALAFLEHQMGAWKPQVVLFDGDRFSYAGALEKIQSIVPDARVALFQATPEQLQARRDARGSKQNAQWLKGRETKAARFFELFDVKKRLMMDGTMTADALAAMLVHWVR